MLFFADKNLICQRVNAIEMNCVLEHRLYEHRIWKEDIQGLEKARISTSYSTSKERIKKKSSSKNTSEKEEYRTVTTISYQVKLHARNGKFNFGHSEEYKPKLQKLEEQINSLINDINQPSFQLYYRQDHPVVSLIYLAGAIAALFVYYVMILPLLIKYYIDALHPDTFLRNLFYRLGIDRLTSQF
ncbi:hypothetical protein H6G54_03425 [Anabaena cylindrica FACHB-243]|nr:MULTISPECIES: hypothetical protein [Anabaena]MBD2416775.1 hypothetical protein [Anabaena cylindrica FACHB-243]MBY5280251.1 hypothetical protein [Anabaena sp. CCAP 1446/1C]MBY5308523.1 hypothetical protein [Anabaena sp. CCAP 1446/1C]MCM2405283.1 hypothetical protein [Anabaena sp. CCAP 1446/1C]